MPKAPELPAYVQAVIDAMPEGHFHDVRVVNTTEYRFILTSATNEVRLNLRYGIMVLRNPTKVMLHYAVQLSHFNLIARLKADLDNG